MGWVRDEVCTSTSVGARYTPKNAFFLESLPHCDNRWVVNE